MASGYLVGLGGLGVGCLEFGLSGLLVGWLVGWLVEWVAG